MRGSRASSAKSLPTQLPEAAQLARESTSSVSLSFPSRIQLPADADSLPSRGPLRPRRPVPGPAPAMPGLPGSPQPLATAQGLVQASNEMSAGGLHLLALPDGIFPDAPGADWF